MSPTALEPLRNGTTFHGRYEIVRIIKAGGMGTVYEVLDQVTRRSRALKTMLPDLVADRDLLSRFRLEATVAAEVDSSHIVEVFDAGIDETTTMPYLVMELLRGKDLGSLLEARGRLGAVDVLVYLRQTALALDKTHANGIVHRDLKPENLFLTTLDDGSPHIKVLDFGIAKVVSQSGTFKTTRNIGTPLYMSPEQIRGDGSIGTASDRYACGHIAFTLLVGQSYWTPEATTLSAAAALLVRVLQGRPEPATLRARALGVELPHGFDAWFDRATAADPAQRFESMRAQIDALAAVLDEDGIGGGAPHVIAASSQARARESRDVGSLPGKSMSVRSSPRTARSAGLGALVLTTLCLLALWAIRHRAQANTTSESRQPTPSRVVDRGPVAVTNNAAREIAPKPADPVSSVSSATLASGKADSTKPPTTLSRARREPARPTPASPPNFDPTDIR